MSMIDLLRHFLRAERLGNWSLYLRSLFNMLPYFAASGHGLYLKSIHLYLQEMSKLPEQHPEVYRQFQLGLHVIRRSDRQWAGISVDQVIKQCLMRSVKTTGGLTRGRGFSEIQHLLWVLSMPVRAEVNKSMQDFAGINYITSEQHKDATNARVARDAKDTKQVIRYASQRSPFTEDTTLRNIATGVTAPAKVNGHDSKNLGKNILASMKGKSVAEFSLLKRDQAVKMDVKSSIKISEEEAIQILH